MRGYEGNGPEGWRRLHDEHYASTRRSLRTLLRRVLGPAKAKSYGDVSAAQAVWDDDVRRFKEATMEMTKDQLIAEMMMVAMATLLPEQLATAMNSLEIELPDDKTMRDYIRRQVRLRLDGNSKDALQHMAPGNEDRSEYDTDEEYAMHLAKALKDAGADEDEIEYMIAFKGNFKGKSKGKGK